MYLSTRLFHTPYILSFAPLPINIKMRSYSGLYNSSHHVSNLDSSCDPSKYYSFIRYATLRYLVPISDPKNDRSVRFNSIRMGLPPQKSFCCFVLTSTIIYHIISFVLVQSTTSHVFAQRESTSANPSIHVHLTTDTHTHPKYHSSTNFKIKNQTPL